ncbi:hypothetical protein LguiB_022318 [Lonicera macranthoides]
MGAIGGEELMKWDKMLQGVASAREEKILVLVRLRPLSEKEIARNEASDWECINDTTILFRNSLQERSMSPTAYTFDRVFSGDCSTRLLYEQGAKEIALSVLSGINSSIFAYGQTSSGKTYTMIGITEYAVADIYDYIHMHNERAFVLKFSAMEIYNEAIRDLLSIDNTPLRLLDDSLKGIIAEKLTQETLRDWSHLKELLSICKAQRKVGETSLNETSSRSHQILRLTIESSAREFSGKDKAATLAASVNFVDLAGSERASQALSAGQRLKEGCHINRSLLTLGTVIRKLSKGGQGHVNYRDSKLTRILQPSLGGNARTAIICTLSPLRSHVEQSRNTLLFGSCAKEVSTNAKVNVVMSDKALVKHLQKELARLKTTTSTCNRMALLKEKDLKIEQLEKEVRELIKQRDLAQSQVEELLTSVRYDRDSQECHGLSHRPKWKQENREENECAVAELSSVTANHCLDTGDELLKTTDSSNGNQRSNEDPHLQFPLDNKDNYPTNETSSSLSNRCNVVRSDSCQTSEDFTLGSRKENSDDICTDVQCIDMFQSRKDKTDDENEASMQGLTVGANEEVADEELVSTASIELSHHKHGFTFEALDDFTFEALYGFAFGALESNIQNVPRLRSKSCSDNLMSCSLSPGYETLGHSLNTPLSDYEENFSGRTGGFVRKLPRLNYDDNLEMVSLNDSPSWERSAFLHGQTALKKTTSKDEDASMVDTSVVVLKEMAKLQCKNQHFDDQDQEKEVKARDYGKNVKDVGLDPMQPSDWLLESEKQLRLIVELWKTCNVSLVHRTYFFLLFRGDPRDSIYMEVEVRRLSFLRETFSMGNLAVEDDNIPTLASSMRALRREREMLSRLMYKRISSKERIRIYYEWGISLDSKHRRQQLVQRLWTDTKDMDHIKDSAAIVAKLIGFSEQGRSLNEMFGLSFPPPPRPSRRYLSWKHNLGFPFVSTEKQMYT